MSKLAAALAWAQRGFAVFPCTPYGKEPIAGASWPDVATNDLDTVRRLWTDPVTRIERNYNVGVDCTNFVVVDVDTKFGKNGLAEYEALGGTYDTLVVRTPSGGYHCYYEGPDSSNAPISDAVDIRSHRGYVMAPGSELGDIPGKQVGGVYEIVNDVEPQLLPYNIERLLRAPYERRLGDYTANDSEANIQAAIRYLETTPVAVEGARGDETTFITAARLVRELALSPLMAFELLRDHWNERCLPPWSLDELEQKVANATNYGTADMGRLDPEKMFRAVPELAPPPSVFDTIDAGFGNALDPLTIPRRPWMIDKLLMQYELTLVLAPGSAGKSSLVLAIIAHLAMGRDFGPYKVHTRCKSIVYNGEDDTAEMSRRLYAVCDAYGFPYAEVKKYVMLLSGEDLDMRLVTEQGGRPVVNDTMVAHIVNLAKDPDVGCIVFDPLVDVHEVDEGDNPKMNTVMKTLKRICREANVAALVPHHTTKAGSAKQEDRIGNMDISRGASGIVYKTRIAFTLLNASAQDESDYGMQEGERKHYVRLDDAKMQYTLADDKPFWFRRDGIKIPSGDIVGVLRISELRKDTNALRIRLAEALMNHMAANNVASLTMVQAIAILKTNEPVMANKTDKDIRQRLEGSFSTPLQVRERTLQVQRSENNKDVLVVMS